MYVMYMFRNMEYLYFRAVGLRVGLSGVIHEAVVYLLSLCVYVFSVYILVVYWLHVCVYGRVDMYWGPSKVDMTRSCDL